MERKFSSGHDASGTRYLFCDNTKLYRMNFVTIDNRNLFLKFLLNCIVFFMQKFPKQGPVPFLHIRWTLHSLCSSSVVLVLLSLTTIPSELMLEFYIASPRHLVQGTKTLEILNYYNVCWIEFSIVQVRLIIHKIY